MGFGVGSATNRGFKGFSSFQGGDNYFQLTVAMGSVAQLVKEGQGRVARIINSSLGAATVTVYDAASPDATTLSTAVVIYSGTLPTSPGTPCVDLQVPVQQGIVVKASSAVAATVLITFV